MNNTEHKKALAALYYKLKNREAESITGLPISGSSRLYFRLANSQKTIIGAYNNDVVENEAFFSFSDTFRKEGISVPKVLAVSENKKYYLLQDLGSITVADYFKQAKKEGSKINRLDVLKRILTDLVKIQIQAGKKLDYSKCYPRESFDAQSIQWDLNYFKYEFLKLVDTPFDEQKLEHDFAKIITQITTQDCSFFMYRDFQLRNIMWNENQPWFIDYQGGRKGPLGYDLASLVYSPTTGLNDEERKELIAHYIGEAQKITPLNKEQFKADFNWVALVRVMQALGAYGYRGIHQRKPGFTSSIQKGILNFVALLDALKTEDLPALNTIADHLKSSDLTQHYQLPKGKLTINIISFSYKRGIPADPSENGGGFVFDCRGIPNPYRILELRPQSGLDKPVVDYLDAQDVAHEFAKGIQATVKVSIDNYLERGFAHLCIYFGCTGGQHRSVYNAERISKWIKENYGSKVILNVTHRERQHWNP